MTKKTTVQMLIEELEDLRMKVYDRESEVLRAYAVNNLVDVYGGQTRELIETRKCVELLDRTIKMLQEQK